MYPALCHRWNRLRRALRQPRQRVLIAHTVGLPKTLEAGKPVRESIARGRDRRIPMLAVESMLTRFRKEFWNRVTIPLTRHDSIGIQADSRRTPRATAFGSVRGRHLIRRRTSAWSSPSPSAFPAAACPARPPRTTRPTRCAPLAMSDFAIAIGASTSGTFRKASSSTASPTTPFLAASSSARSGTMPRSTVATTNGTLDAPARNSTGDSHRDRRTPASGVQATAHVR